jgi:coproporphyrinogen III oxidase-like Fe-S oxidoreductase
MQSNGLLELSEQKLSITAPGRLYTLTVCQLFDDYLAQDTNQTPSLVQMM